MPFLPTTKKEMERLGWQEADVIIFSGDAYIDHPSFATAVIGRILEADGYKVAVVPQPDWHGDFRDFKKLGRPRLFFAISPGCMDSMVNKYTANRRLRSEDAYTPDGRHDKRPEYPTIVYTNILKQLFPDVPVIIGGIEASMRRLTHYDYWQDRLRPSILVDSHADILIYGMGEKPIRELANIFASSPSTTEALVRAKAVPQIAYLSPLSTESSPRLSHTSPPDSQLIILHSHEECLRDKRKQAENFKHIEDQSNLLHPQTLTQQVGNQYVVVNPPYPPLSQEELDHSFDLPYTRLPHPKYNGKVIPAYEMIKLSDCMHRGCFGGCAFCTISAHQGKFVCSRSKESILREVKQISQMPDFKGYLSDLGGPSANMYAMQGKDRTLCSMCRRPSCIFPKVCKNLNNDHSPLLSIYREVDSLPQIKKSFISSGVRYDLVMSDEKAGRRYANELIRNHVSGRLKVAPEHTEDKVLKLMRKPSFELFYDFKRFFDNTCRQAGLRQQIIPYFISAHPGCSREDMKRLAEKTRKLGFRLEQVQEFTPTPMTLSTEIYYTGINPHTGEEIHSAKTDKDKKAQHQYFFWYKE
ncbi:MAG: YgiQ family radical SAM protein [Prevotellaceae bacterium]|nr:YgiQ family radical SAM protein [Candidatus Colivivens equi]